jgi:hypothetical protein
MAQTQPGTSDFPESSQNVHPIRIEHTAKSDDMEHPSQGPQTLHYLYSSRKRRVLRFWAWEILSVFLAMGLLVAIFSILVHFNGRPVPSLPFSITLNTLIALLATIMRLSIIFAVAEILGQAKWLWFSRPTASPMNNLQHFDSASRGLFGSLRLLFVAPNSIFAFLGSIVVAASLGIGSFSQQAVKAVDCVQYMGQVNASVPVAQYMGYPGGPADPTYAIGPGDGLTNMQLPVDMKGTMVNGLVNPAGNDSAISATCPTGNCTFQAYSDNITYSSIGFCSACIDTTPFVTSNGSETFHNATFQPNWILPNGMNIYLANGNTLLSTSTDGDLSWASPAFADEFRNVALESIVNATILTFTQAPCTNISGSLSCPHNVTGTASNGEWDYAAASCALYPCLKNYHGSVNRGLLTEDIISSAQAKFNWIQANLSEYTYYSPSQTFMAPGNVTALNDPCVIDGFEYTAASNFSGLPETPERRFTPININWLLLFCIPFQSYNLIPVPTTRCSQIAQNHVLSHFLA